MLGLSNFLLKKTIENIKLHLSHIIKGIGKQLLVMYIGLLFETLNTRVKSGLVN